MIDEILNVIRTVYDEADSYNDAELQESLAVIINDLEQFITLYLKQPLCPIGSGSPADEAFLSVYSAFKKNTSELLANNVITKNYMADGDREIINRFLVTLNENLTAFISYKERN